MKIIILVAIILAVAFIGKPQNGSFLFTQDYGYCDTTGCYGQSIILGDYSLPLAKECYPKTFTTSDTSYQGYYLAGFTFYYNTEYLVSVNFGNGVTKKYRGSGIDTINYLCNQNYEVIICYE